MLRQMKGKFGDIPAQYVQRVQEADPETLLLWSEKILDATTLQEMIEDV